MLEQLKNQIELLFEDAPKTRKALELKEEFISNAIDRYDDLIQDGIREDDAYKNVMNSIGDVNELFNTLEEKQEDGYSAERQKRSALITAISVGLYIIAGIVFIGGSEFLNSTLALLIGAAICIIPTCMLVYNSIAYPDIKKKARNEEETIVEEFKQWSADTRKLKAVKNSVISIITTITLILYLLISFLSGAWYITWIIWLIGGCAVLIAELIFRIKEL